MNNKKGFTLIELLSVLILLVVIVTIAMLNFMPTFEDSKKRALLDEAHVFSQGVMNKYNDDRLSKTYYSDVFASRNAEKKCYTIKSLFDRYVQKDNNKKYEGSIEVCTSNSCTYKTKLWLTNGDYYLNGVIVDEDLDLDSIDDEKYTEYFNSCGVDISNIDYSWLFDYSGAEETFTVPIDGTYSLEVWGAQGGNVFYSGYEPLFYSFQRWYGTGGYGGYAYTEVDLKQGDTLFVSVGGEGSYNIFQPKFDAEVLGPGGFNGGGHANYHSGGGGGATHVALKSGFINQLKIDDILVVAGGGGAATARPLDDREGIYNGGSAGGYCNSNSGICIGSGVYGDVTGLGAGGGLYTSGGAKTNYNAYPVCAGSLCWYRPDYDSNMSFAYQGGTGYTGNPRTRNGIMATYNPRDTYNNDFNKTVATSDVSEDPITLNAKIGNGYAKITLIV